MALTVLNWSTVLLQLPLSFNHSHRLAMEKPAEGMGGGKYTPTFEKVSKIAVE